MIGAVAVGLATQLALTAAAKGRTVTPRPASQLVARLDRWVPARAWAVGDGFAAALVLWPLATVPTAYVVALSVVGSEFAVFALRPRGVTSCGCLGAASATYPWREHAAKAVVLAESLMLVLGADVGVTVGGSVLAALVAVGVLVLLTPGSVSESLRRGPLALHEARQALERNHAFRRWAPQLLNPGPVWARLDGRTWNLAFDAWNESGLVLVTAKVTPTRVEVTAQDASREPAVPSARRSSWLPS